MWLAVAWALSLILIACTGNNASPTAQPASGATATYAGGTIASAQSVPALGNELGAAQLMAGGPEMVSQLTGAKSPARTDVLWNLVGTDLGFSFKYHDKTYMVFGDTWGRDGWEGDDWRSNTMAIVEPDPTYGYVLTDVIRDENGEAKELLPSLKRATMEYTVIPSSGIAVGDRMYLHYLSILDWKETWWDYKQPVANYSGFAYSEDGGQTWIKDVNARWYGNSAFAQTAMVKVGDYVYVFGTPAGRFGPARLLRVRAEHLLDKSQYEYWAGEVWSSDANHAAEVAPAPVGELSVRWSEYTQQWLMMYANEITHNVVLRTAAHLEGPWSEERVIVSGAEYPTLYAPLMLPITGPDVYFAMSIFDPHYQVFVMRFRP